MEPSKTSHNNLKLLYNDFTFGANRTDEGSFGVVAQLVPLQVIFSLQPRAANVADESPFDFVAHQVLFEQLFFRIGHVTFRTTEQRGAVQRSVDMDLEFDASGKVERTKDTLMAIISWVTENI